MADFLNPNLNLITRTWIPIAETRDLKMKPPSKLSGFRSPFACRHAPTANRDPPTASTFARVSYFPSAAVIDFTTAFPSVAEPSGLKWTSALFWCCARVGVIAALRSSMATSFSFMTLRAMSL